MDKININRDGLTLHREAWLDQFKQAMAVSPDNDETDENGEPLPTVLSSIDYVLHFLSFFWKGRHGQCQLSQIKKLIPYLLTF